MHHRMLICLVSLGILALGCGDADPPRIAFSSPSGDRDVDLPALDGGSSNESNSGTDAASGEVKPQVVLDAWGDFPKDVFFEDPFAELGEGESDSETTSPSQELVQHDTTTTTEESLAASGSGPEPSVETPEPAVVWSELIPAEVLLEETTRLSRELEGQLSSVARYNEDWRAVRVEANVLAALGGIAAIHDDSIPWKSRATTVRDTAAELASSVRGLGESSQKPAQSHYTKIRDLLTRKQSADPHPIFDMPWSNVVDRSQLMRRMKLAQEDRIKPFVSDARNFRRNAESLAHEASLLTALAQVISTSYDESDDEAYRNFCHTLRDQSKGLAQAARDGDFSRAAELAGANLKTCNACHADFRFEESEF